MQKSKKKEISLAVKFVWLRNYSFKSQIPYLGSVCNDCFLFISFKNKLHIKVFFKTHPRAAVVIIFVKIESLRGMQPIRSSFSLNVGFVFSESLLHKINKHLISISDCWLTNVLFEKSLAGFVQLLW